MQRWEMPETNLKREMRHVNLSFKHHSDGNLLPISFCEWVLKASSAADFILMESVDVQAYIKAGRNEHRVAADVWTSVCLQSFGLSPHWEVDKLFSV